MYDVCLVIPTDIIVKMARDETVQVRYLAGHGRKAKLAPISVTFCICHHRDQELVGIRLVFLLSRPAAL